MTAHCPTDLRQENPRTESCPAATAESGRLGTVIHFCLAPDGGVWSHIRLLAAHQRPQWRVMVVAVSRGAPRKEVFAEAEACCDRSLIDTRPAITGIYYLAPLNVRRVLRELGVDPRQERVVYHFHTGPSTPWFFRIDSRLPGRRLVTYHGSRGNFRDTGVRGFPRRLFSIGGTWRMHRAGFRFIAVSRRSAEDGSAMYFLPESEFRVAYSGVIAGGAQRAPRKPDDTAPFHIGFLGTVQPGKGWDRVIAACKLLRERGRNIVCTVAGEGGDSARLNALAKQHASWLRAPGRLRNPATTFLPSLDVFVLPSDFEGLPLVLPEAMSCGVPCICTDVGGCTEAVRDGQEGFVLRGTSPDEIANCITRLMDDHGLWRRFSDNGRRRYEEMFTPERMCSSLEDVYLGMESP